ASAPRRPSGSSDSTGPGAGSGAGRPAGSGVELMGTIVSPPGPPASCGRSMPGPSEVGAPCSASISAARPRALRRPFAVLGRELPPALDDDAQHPQHDPRDSGRGGGQDAPPRVAGAGQDQEQRLAGEDPTDHGAGVGAG